MSYLCIKIFTIYALLYSKTYTVFIFFSQFILKYKYVRKQLYFAQISKLLQFYT